MKTEGLRRIAIVLLFIDITLLLSGTFIFFFEARNISQAFSLKEVPDHRTLEWLLAILIASSIALSIPILIFYALPIFWLITRRAYLMTVVFNILAMGLNLLIFCFLVINLILKMDLLPDEKFDSAKSYIKGIGVIGISKLLFDIMVSMVLACLVSKTRRIKEREKLKESCSKRKIK